MAQARPAILVIDDEENFLALLRWFLTFHDCNVYTASNRRDALRLTEEQSFDLALVDVRLGPVDGLLLLRDLRQRLPLIKVVMMTSHPTVETIKQAFAEGAVGFVSKPVELRELLKTIQRFTEKFR